jgi:hypothetical protein
MICQPRKKEKVKVILCIVIRERERAKTKSHKKSSKNPSPCFRLVHKKLYASQSSRHAVSNESDIFLFYLRNHHKFHAIVLMSNIIKSTENSIFYKSFICNSSRLFLRCSFTIAKKKEENLH